MSYQKDNTNNKKQEVKSYKSHIINYLTHKDVICKTWFPHFLIDSV